MAWFLLSVPLCVTTAIIAYLAPIGIFRPYLTSRRDVIKETVDDTIDEADDETKDRPYGIYPRRWNGRLDVYANNQALLRHINVVQYPLDAQLQNRDTRLVKIPGKDYIGLEGLPDTMPSLEMFNIKLDFAKSRD